MHKQRSGFVIKSHKSAFYKDPVAYGTRLCDRGSSSLDTYVRCINTNKQSAFILDYRVCPQKRYFIPRYFTKTELNKLFYFPDNYVLNDKYTVYTKLYGMSVVPPVIHHILCHL